MNPLETAVFAKMTTAFKLDWLKALSALKGPSSIAAIGALLDFSDTVEHAIVHLRTHASTHPAMVAQQLAFRIKKDKLSWTLGIPLLKELPEAERNIGLTRVSRIKGDKNPTKWKRQVAAIRMELRS
jgi:hypothetical protein